MALRVSTTQMTHGPTLRIGTNPLLVQQISRLGCTRLARAVVFTTCPCRHFADLGVRKARLTRRRGSAVRAMSPHTTCVVSAMSVSALGRAQHTRSHNHPCPHTHRCACLSRRMHGLSPPFSQTPCLVGKKEQSPDVDDSGRMGPSLDFRPYPAGRSPPPGARGCSTDSGPDVGMATVPSLVC